MASQLIDEIARMDEPIRFDGSPMSGSDFQAIALDAAKDVRGKAIVFTVSTDPTDLPVILGLISGGAKVFALPGFFGGGLADHLSRLFLAHADALPNGTLASVSSGTTGMPKINVVTPQFMLPGGIDEMLSFGHKVFPTMMEGRAFMTAPMQATVPSYLASLALGIPVSMMSARPTAESLSAFVSTDDLSIMTKGPVVAKLHAAGYKRKFDCFLSASSPLGEDSIRMAREVFDWPDIVDVYSCTEAGILGARSAEEPFFWLAPGITGADDALFSETTVGTITDSGYEPKDTVDTGDAIETHGELVRLVGRTKDKVSGFSVFPVEVRSRLVDGGLDVQSVYVEEGVLVCAHRGRINESDVSDLLSSYGFPSYSIPRRFVLV